MYKNKTIIAIGNFLFKHRNYLFPSLILIMFLAIPPQNTFWGSSDLLGNKTIIAFLVAIIGLGIRATVIGFAYIKRGGLNKKVYADDLVTTGIFQICRNPLYVGNVIIYLSIFLMHGSTLIIVFGTLLFTFIYVTLIAAEENFLANKFGAQFDEYCAKTPRWIPNLSKLSAAVKDMEFDFKKVVLKDYTTVFNTLAILFGIKLYEVLTFDKDYFSAFALVVAIVGMGVGIYFIKAYKKRSAEEAATAASR